MPFRRHFSHDSLSMLLPFTLIFSVFIGFTAFPAHGLELEPFPFESFTRDEYSFSFFREEKPSFYWVNAGVPDAFFTGINLVQDSRSMLTKSAAIRNIEYGVRSGVWASSQFHLRLTLPFEANSLTDVGGQTHNEAKFGDLELGATYLVIGKRENGNYVGIDGWARLPTGTNPFAEQFPMLSTGRGCSSETLGIVAGEELGGFSFFQSIHYEKNQAILVQSANPLFGQGTFQWPDYLHATGRIEYQLFRRAQRAVSCFYELRTRISGTMEFNQQPVYYAQALTTDQLIFSNSGLKVRVDKEFTAEGSLSYFPYEFGGLLPVYRPNDGWLFSFTLEFRPF